MDKREIAANLILRAVKLYVQAENDMDYIQAILLGGSSIGITEPLLEEQGDETATEKSALVCMKMASSEIYLDNNKFFIKQGSKPLSNNKKSAISDSTRIFERGVYNSLKHTGRKSKKNEVAASEDLIIEADFKLEAEEIIYSAIHDFNCVKFDQEFRYEDLPEEILLLLNGGDPMGIIPMPVVRERKY